MPSPSAPASNSKALGSEASDKEVVIHYNNPDVDRFSDESVHNRRQQFVTSRSLSQYAVTLDNQPQDVSTFKFKDDKFHFFAKGRDFQPNWKYHKYTPEEIKILETYEGSSTLPANSEIYREWTSARLRVSSDKVGWGHIMIISIVVGTLTFMMKQLCEYAQIFQNPFIQQYIQHGQPDQLLVYHASVSCCLVAFAAIICVYACPFASGSGIPEIVCILNGTVVRNALAFKTLVCKTISVSLAVLSGLPIGYEGPLIHIGGMIGAQLSRPVNCGPPCKLRRIYTVADEFENENNGRKQRCCRYQDSEERHSLISLGAACGIASAFRAPLSAILFVIEEISTHWSVMLTWKAFVCCMMARSMTEILENLEVVVKDSMSSLTPEFTFVKLSQEPVFNVKTILTLNLVILIPAIIIGISGGILGAFYIFLHLKFAKIRRKLLGKIKKKDILNVVKVLEPVLLALISTVIIMETVLYIPCKPIKYQTSKSLAFHAFQCSKGEYNEAATLLFGSWEQMVRNLLSRESPEAFSLGCLSVIFCFFFMMSNLAALTSIASGLMIPQLACGALFGRIVGVITHDIVRNKLHVDLNSTNPVIKEEWEWLDPGAFALLGAASFMAGTTRLPISSVVIMIEMTNDISMSVLLMIVVMLSKVIGDYFTHSLYHSLIEFKCIPFLDYQLDIQYQKHRLDLELFKISHVMVSPVRCINLQESVQTLANLLLDTNHGAFPVITNERGLDKTFVGLISRMELTILLTRTASFNANELQAESRERIRISYPDYSTTKIKDLMTTNLILNNFATDYRYEHVTVNLIPYVNTSAFNVKPDMSLQRGYKLFRMMGLRHLVVTDRLNQIVGILTRKDLMCFQIVRKLRVVMHEDNDGETASHSRSIRRIRNQITKRVLDTFHSR